ncbi:hypothetical protein SGFS_004520 [Streptomyces graminofaciens]|uniref:IstB-like ATP-binding domain-containing protein n=1 Tax=Streptomyces graminofaciens TaxID=68212 RepID=A0ABM7F0D2_9ACTN|nr:hypothetical protein SGFS_004520 [Streptomyces graminofaciens]
MLTEREEKNSVAIASHESFGGWTITFTDPRLCAALNDHLPFGGNIIETGTESYRLASARAAQAQDTRDEVPRKRRRTLLVSSDHPQWEQGSPGDAPWTDWAKIHRCSASAAELSVGATKAADHPAPQVRRAAPKKRRPLRARCGTRHGTSGGARAAGGPSTKPLCSPSLVRYR